MLLKVRLWGPLARYGKGGGSGEFFCQSAEGTTPRLLLEQLGIPLEYVSMVSVNGTKCERDRLLRDGDTVHVLPLVAGG